MPSLKFIPFQIRTLVDVLPVGEGWVHEIKHDGYRTELIVEGGDARAFTRNGHDWSERYPHIVGAAKAIPVRNAIIDGGQSCRTSLGSRTFTRCEAP